MFRLTPYFFSFCLFTFPCFSMDDDPGSCNEKRPSMVQGGAIDVEEQDKLLQIAREYQEGKPVGIGAACGSEEVSYKIMNTHGSTTPPIENWIGLDLFLTNEDPIRKGPHIRMDVTNTEHWKHTINYLKLIGIEEVQTVAMTICVPLVSSPIVRNTILPFVKKGGKIIYPGYFHPADYFFRSSGFQPPLSSRYTTAFYESLQSYFSPQGTCYKNKEALLSHTMKWIGDARGTMGPGNTTPRVDSTDAGKQLEAQFFVNNIASFNPDFLEENGRLNEKKWREARKKSSWDPVTIYGKTQKQFDEGFFSLFPQYMNALGFDPSSYAVYSDDPGILGTTHYQYPQDGTFKLTGYGGPPSLVLFKQ